MNDSIYYVSSIFFVVSATANYLMYINILQDKSYRVDRLIKSFQSFELVRSVFLNWLNILKILAIVTYFLSIQFYSIVGYYSYIVCFVLAVTCIKVLYEIIQKKIQVPQLNVFFALFTVLTGFFLFFLYSFPLVDKFFWLLLIEKIIPVIIIIITIVISILSDFHRDIQINRAYKKLSANKKLTKIVITGSYHKTATKQFIRAVLSAHRQVVVNTREHSTIMDFANLVLRNVTPLTDFFVVEVPLYKKGQLAEICDFLKPNIGIFTGVDARDLLYFKNYSQVFSIDQELLGTLVDNGLVLFNGNNLEVLRFFEQIKNKKIAYATTDINTKIKNKIIAKNIRQHNLKTSFTLFTNDREIGKFSVNLIGKKFIETLLPAIFIAQRIKLSSTDLALALSKIIPVKHVLEPYRSSKKTIFIDDTRSSSPTSTFVAFDAIAKFKGKKIVVFSPRRDLGRSGEIIHKKIGLIAGALFDTMFVTNKNYQTSIKKGIFESDGECKMIYMSSLKVAHWIEDNLSEHDVVLFEGEESKHVFHLISSESVYR